MRTTPAQGLGRLRAASASGDLETLCVRHGVRLLTVFGSTSRDEPRARDLDIGVFFEPGVRADILGLINDLITMTGVEAVDLAHLNRAGPVLRVNALVGSILLFESVEGAFFSLQTAAMGERIDTDPMRRLDLELLAQ